MAQCSRVLAALAEDQSLVTNTHVVANNCLKLQFQETLPGGSSNMLFSIVNFFLPHSTALNPFILVFVNRGKLGSI